MIVNKRIKEFYKEISQASILHQNTKDPDRVYHKRLLDLYMNYLTEEEQLYILASLLESVHFKNIVTDPDNVLTLHTVRLRNITYIFLFVTFIVILTAALFKTNSALNYIVDVLGNGFKLLSL